jgi:multidrug efflux pump subunit AcrA (membrane-fusion protein)
LSSGARGRRPDRLAASGTPSSARRRTRKQRYKLATIEKGDVTQTVSANGTLNPVVLVSVGTQVSGTVKKLYVDFNDKVEKGQALLELDDALARRRRQSAANVANAQARWNWRRPTRRA